MKRPVRHNRVFAFLAGCAALLSAGGCDPLSDQQLTAILTSVIQTALTAMTQNILGGAL